MRWSSVHDPWSFFIRTAECGTAMSFRLRGPARRGGAAWRHIISPFRPSAVNSWESARLCCDKHKRFTPPGNEMPTQLWTADRKIRAAAKKCRQMFFRKRNVCWGVLYKTFHDTKMSSFNQRQSLMFLLFPHFHALEIFNSWLHFYTVQEAVLSPSFTSVSSTTAQTWTQTSIFFFY